MIPPRLRAWLASAFILDYVIDRGPKRGKRIVSFNTSVMTNAGHIRPMDLRSLEKKGLVSYEVNEIMTGAFGLLCWDVKVTDAGKEELSEEYATRRAIADESNARLENPEPLGEGFDELDEERAETSEASEARARQRAARRS